MRFKAVIFDMDGVLIDSMLYWMEADEFYLREIGVNIDNQLHEEMVTYMSGRHEDENMPWLQKRLGISDENMGYLLKKREIFARDIYTIKTKIMPGVVKLMKKLKEAGIKMAIASGAPACQVEQAVSRFCWEDDFCVTVSADHVNCIGKPDPAIYLHTAEKLGVGTKDCVVIEDAENGVISAKNAGMKCVAVPDPRWSFGDFSKADLIVKSLEDEKVYDFLGLPM